MPTPSTVLRCLTDIDRALLNAVTGWHLPGSATILPAPDSAGRPMLIPVLAWVLADARRQGKIAAEVTPGFFEIAVHAVNQTHSASLRLTDKQIGNGRRYLHSRFAKHMQKHAARFNLGRGGSIACDRAAAAAS